MVRIPVPGEEMPPLVDDDIYNYSLSFLRVAMDLLQFDDLVKSGDIDRLTIVMKRLCPTFIGLTSYRSKYAIECVNFLTKTECLLSEKDSVKVKLEAFGILLEKLVETKLQTCSRRITLKWLRQFCMVLVLVKQTKQLKDLQKQLQLSPVLKKTLRI